MMNKHLKAFIIVFVVTMAFIAFFVGTIGGLALAIHAVKVLSYNIIVVALALTAFIAVLVPSLVVGTEAFLEWIEFE